MTDWLLGALTDWQKSLTERRIRARITAAETHLQSALAALSDIETNHGAHRAKVRLNIRATLIDLARYKHARGMIDGRDIMAAARGNQV